MLGEASNAYVGSKPTCGRSFESSKTKGEAMARRLTNHSGARRITPPANPNRREELAVEARRVQERIDALETAATLEQGKATFEAKDARWCHAHAFGLAYYKLTTSHRATSAGDAFARDEHLRIFGSRPEVDTPAGIVKARIFYHLQYLGFEEAGVLDELTPAFLQNYKAAMRLDTSLRGYTSSMKYLMGLSVAEHSEDGRRGTHTPAATTRVVREERLTRKARRSQERLQALQQDLAELG